ncbi:MAG: hypothetical protein LQ346_002286 [Caloplaca aetnensis]|nr:MAG: hypothetical protein LQ346_002286 [Caloplaca aetnensis]
MSTAGSGEQASSQTPSPFLSLPLEIRRLVYHELLLLGAIHWHCPFWHGTSLRSHVLFHDRAERQQKLLLHVPILRTNKQINAEATPVLYEQNAFLINISLLVNHQSSAGMCPNRRGNPPNLFRIDGHNPPRHFPAPGLIYPHCIQRLANLEIIVSAHSVWGGGFSGSEFFTHIGELLLGLLHLLARDEWAQTPYHRKRLVLTVIKRHDHWSGGTDNVLFPRMTVGSRFPKDSLTAKTGERLLIGEVGPLLRTLCERRKVSINEVVVSHNVEWDSELCEKRTAKVTQRWVPMEEIESL